MHGQKSAAPPWRRYLVPCRRGSCTASVPRSCKVLTSRRGREGDHEEVSDTFPAGNVQCAAEARQRSLHASARWEPEGRLAPRPPRGAVPGPVRGTRQSSRGAYRPQRAVRGHTLPSPPSHPCLRVRWRTACTAVSPQSCVARCPGGEWSRRGGFRRRLASYARCDTELRQHTLNANHRGPAESELAPRSSRGDAPVAAELSGCSDEVVFSADARAMCGTQRDFVSAFPTRIPRSLPEGSPHRNPSARM